MNHFPEHITLKGGQVEAWNFILERFKEICSRSKRQRRYLKIKSATGRIDLLAPAPFGLSA
jgi:hypothetical protein